MPVLGSGHVICLSVPILPRVALDSLSHHAVSCRHGGDTVIRHNKLRDIVADLYRKAHLSVRVEAGHGMCRDNNHSRPADILVEGWERDIINALSAKCIQSGFKTSSSRGLCYFLSLCGSFCSLVNQARATPSILADSLIDVLYISCFPLTQWILPGHKPSSL